MKTGQIAGIAGVVVVVVILLVVMTVEPEEDKENITVGGTVNPQVDPVDNATARAIQEKYERIERQVSENKYKPKPQEWITSGPFQIDRSEYIIGEKIFVRVGILGPDEKGQIAFLRPLNDTHYSVYRTIAFDGLEKPTFNQYFQPGLSKINGYCTVDDLVGDWRVVFRGTEYPNLEFKITGDILPGDEEYYEPVC